MLASSCSLIIDKQVNKFSDQLSNTIMNYDDPATVGSAIPTLLIVVDNAASGDNASAQLKLSAAQMYGAFSSAFVNEPERQKVLTNRGFNYAKAGSCATHKIWCDVPTMNGEDFNQFVASLNEKDVPIVYAYAASWLAYIQAHSDNWSVIADLGRAKQLLEVVIKYDEAYDNASAHLYLGAIATTLPPALGGQPDIGQQHFERALALTDNKNLLVKVEYARRFARNTFDQELHHRLLTEVLAADFRVPDLTLMNAWARQQAQQLLATEADYFDWEFYYAPNIIFFTEFI